jgi:hypothetical protein
MDEIVRREQMEAFENMGLPLKRGGEPRLHRVDPAVVGEILAAGSNGGFARLRAMLDDVLPRLVDGAGTGDRR